MNRDVIRLLFALLRCSVRGNELRECEKELITEEVFAKLLAIAKKHDIEHLVAFAVKQNSIFPNKSDVLENIVLKSAFRHRQLRYEYEKLCEIFEDEQIDFIPLKGSVIRQYYPEPWMRTSCDIDILIHEEDIEKTSSMLVSKHEYSLKEKNSHDVSLFSPNNVHLELHYALVEDGIAKESSDILKSVWECALHRNGFEFCFDMPDEMFYFYHVAHMAKHFENGGCGIRPFLDLWLLDNIETKDVIKRNALLEKGNLLKFAEVARKLSRVWLEDAEADELSLRMEEFIIRGGVYGTNENRIAIQQQKKGGKFKYALSRIFLPYSELKFHYPVLQKHKWLTPFMQVRRWFKLLFCGGARRSVNELKYNAAITSDKAAETQKFLSDIGL